MIRALATALVATSVVAMPVQAAVTLAGTDKFQSIQIFNRSGAHATSDTTRNTPLRDDVKTVETNTLPSSAISLSTQISTSDASGDTTASASATGSATAAFESAAKGTITFAGTFASDVSGTQKAFGESFTENHFIYLFSSDQDATFTIDYLLSGPVCACFKNNFQFFDRTEYSPDSGLLRWMGGTDLADRVSAQVRAGHIYELKIDRSDSPGRNEIPYQAGAGSTRFSNSSVFSFAISTASAVPEPTSWALMICGFGLTGAALRLRRRTALRPPEGQVAPAPLEAQVSLAPAT
ncbi:hypothetical protein GCM10022253_00610 [Sphingomonas endophytica]|uniref:PEP-CTERM protein-sorting domain-containing protein n=1 Tax=Sphingomonas endophytica TaxID=869719 RepID=A0ABR6N340_9SPHN|nr:PEPxxWA-CTERM sorting domain-containing protein [Sphingomonas endophytica]MBB5725212.1 hypothetical protein [Sphingomonas endophytica]